MINERLFQGIMDESHRLGTFGTGFTYSGHPVPAAVAIETLKIYDEIGLIDHVRQVGPYMHKMMEERFAEHPLVGEIRGVGLIGAVELVADKATHRNFDPEPENRRALGQADGRERADRTHQRQRLGCVEPAVDHHRE